MERVHYDEMKESVRRLTTEGALRGKRIYLFGHCNATEELADLLLDEGETVTAILDNSKAKYGKEYRHIPIQPPTSILRENADETIVCIVTRFYEAMNAQLKSLGFTGRVEKLVDYNTYAAYSLSDETIARKRERLRRGQEIVSRLDEAYDGAFRVFCPFVALGDIYMMASYLPHYMKKRGVKRCVVCVASKACADVVKLFDAYSVEIMEQKELDAAIQATIHSRDENAFIAHQDRPYVVNLSKALYVKNIPLETIYRCGVFGLPQDCAPCQPANWQAYPALNEIKQGRSAILAPYAKSVTALPDRLWTDIANDLRANDYAVYTNVTGDEKPLAGTKAISPAIAEMKSVVERAGLFIGIRSGICDVLRTADCRMIVLYPRV